MFNSIFTLTVRVESQGCGNFSLDIVDDLRIPVVDSAIFRCVQSWSNHPMEQEKTWAKWKNSLESGVQPEYSSIFTLVPIILLVLALDSQIVYSNAIISLSSFLNLMFALYFNHHCHHPSCCIQCKTERATLFTMQLWPSLFLPLVCGG